MEGKEIRDASREELSAGRLAISGENTMEKSESVTEALKSDLLPNLAEQDVASGEDGKTTVLMSSVSSPGDATSSIKGEIDQEPVSVQGVYCPSTSCYDYYYPGFNGTFTQPDDQNGLNSGFQSDNGSLLYYYPGYTPYGTGSFMGADGQQPYYSPPGYIQHPVSYGSEAVPCYSWDSSYVGDVANGTAGFSGKSKSSFGFNASTQSNYSNYIKPSSTDPRRFSTLPLESKTGKPAATSNISKSALGSQPLKTVGKLGYGYQSAGVVKAPHPAGKLPSFINQNAGLYTHNLPMTYRPHGRVLYGNDRVKLRDRHGELDASTELTRGPRAAQNESKFLNQSSEENQTEQTIKRDKYNLEEFQTQYDNAKFYVIKSYSEDDIHKCIKYDVWSSTPNGNQKLDAAFHEAEEQANVAGARCPVFLFFSVNGSGQFVGVAEMAAPVDFNKNMDFWQLDKWNGFFPVKWHIIKDIPNTQLRHIILENNENRPVTYSRDTQEIGLKQGIEMLNIFKSYSVKTSVLDDFDFYEAREQLLKARRSFKQDSVSMREESGERTSDEPMTADGSSSPTSSVINLTKNLSLKSHSMDNGDATNPIDNSSPCMTNPKASPG